MQMLVLHEEGWWDLAPKKLSTDTLLVGLSVLDLMAQSSSVHVLSLEISI